MSQELNKYSRRITQAKSQGASQAMLYGTGMTEEDMSKAQIGIASVWYEGNTCNMHLNKLAEKVKEGVVQAGLLGMRFNTIGVSDGISMGTEGMSYSLQSRDLIADSIETVVGAQWYDGLIALPGCDKNMPGCLMAMGRLNRPAIMVYGGTIRPGRMNGEKLDIVSAFQCYGQYLAGTISEEQRREIVKRSCPGAGACGGCTRPTPWRPPLRRWECPFLTVLPFPPKIPRRSTNAAERERAMRLLLEKTSNPAIS
jgi:dihydroxy-acid dehydratase